MQKYMREDLLTYFEVLGGHHGFDFMSNSRGFALMDAIEQWLLTFRAWHAQQRV